MSTGGTEVVVLIAERGHPGSCWMGDRFEFLIRESSIYLSPAPCLVNFFAVFSARKRGQMPVRRGLRGYRLIL